MLLDLSRLNGIAVNDADGTAIIGPGCFAGELNAALVKHKLFFPVAHAYTVGIQLADENLGRRPMPFMAPVNLERLDALRAKFDPGGRFNAYMGRVS